MKDLRNYTVKEFAKEIKEDATVIANLMRNNTHLSYIDKPFENTLRAVKNSTVNENNTEIVAKFIYTNLFNRPEHRFYDTKGYTVTLR